ncbi:hypothetical protein V5799_023757 [Amblyomma americanum]|uniref:Uncharacterized protein n=1 Tax=Amblyomma americanum TaxID=6943 RepID=A0AAQ4FID4_AMBAM
MCHVTKCRYCSHVTVTKPHPNTGSRHSLCGVFRQLLPSDSTATASVAELRFYPELLIELVRLHRFLCDNRQLHFEDMQMKKDRWERIGHNRQSCGKEVHEYWGPLAVDEEPERCCEEVRR